MAFLNRETGELSFSDGLRLSAGLPVGEVAELLGDELDGIVRLSSHTVAGGRMIPVCAVDHGSVHSISLCPSAIGGREPGSAEKQRAFLFSRLGLRDPVPDSLQSVQVRCPFGEIMILSDPHTGRSEARIIYAVR